MTRQVAALVLCLLLLPAAPARGQVTAPLEQLDLAAALDTGSVVNNAGGRRVIASEIVQVPGAAWLRLRFDAAILGDAPAGGEPTVLRITSLLDAAVQTMRAEHLPQWQYTSAYFNGNAVLVEIIADAGAAPSRVTGSRVFAGPGSPALPRSICGGVDDRIPSYDPRVARKFPTGCTAWLIDDANHCFLTAGHCTSGLTVVEFNVPLSNPDGSPAHPGPEDQYPVDPASMQSNGGQGVGNDWAYFGCFANSTTGLTAYETQGACFELADAAPPAFEQLVRIIGFGTTDSSVPPEWHRAQKSHSGPYVSLSGNAVNYQTDTTGGNSGSPVLLSTTGQAIGIHTHGGCSSGANHGTAVQHPALQAALANPQGVCIPLPDPADVNDDGVVDVGDVLQILGAWGDCPAPCPPTCAEDVDESCAVDVSDLLAALAAWG